MPGSFLHSTFSPRLRNRPRRTALLVIIAVLCVGGLWGYQRVHSAHEMDQSVFATPPMVEPRPQIKPVSDHAPAPTIEGIASALDPLTASPVLARFSGAVMDGVSGQLLWQREGSQPMIPASTMKLITAAAAVVSLPLDSVLTTRIVSGDNPHQVIIIGAGDPTLSAAPAEEETFYPHAPRLDDLVNKVREHHPEPIQEVLVDVSGYEGADFAPGWLREDIEGGFIAPAQPLMLDGGRIIRSLDESPRTPEPALEAGRELARRLGADPIKTRIVKADPHAQEWAAVSSAPLRERIRQFMLASDNVLAEAVGREIARGDGKASSLSGAVEAEQEVLQRIGVDISSAHRVDSNGLSLDNRVSAEVLARIIVAATGGSDALRPLLDFLPVASATGTLYERFSDPTTGRETSGAGWVRAKTGSLDNVATLAGETVNKEGRVVAFAFLTNEGAVWETRAALDAFASALRDCGCQ